MAVWALAVVVLSGCSGEGRRPPPPAPTAPALGATAPTVVEVAYRVERRTTDPATEDFAAVVESTLSDPRGWSRAGFRLVRRPDAPFLVVLAEGDEVDRLCLPYDTYGEYSCQNGPVVALNADRWRYATPKWTGDLASFRQMLVNHEVGHLLGQHHPRRHCPRPGRPAPVMGQQSTELNGCLPNPWPLPDEIALAARHDQPLAPPFSREAPATQGEGGDAEQPGGPSAWPFLLGVRCLTRIPDTSRPVNGGWSLSSMTVFCP
jgi:hypothetical protein